MRLLIADDHEIVREGLRNLLSNSPEIEVAGEASNGIEAVELTLKLKPDVLLLDLMMPSQNGIATIQALRERKCPTRILVLSSFADDAQVREALSAGAEGYLLKDVLKQDLIQAIVSTSRGVPALHPEVQKILMRQVKDNSEASKLDTLTDREGDVLRLIASGRSNKEIASTLGLTEGTIKGYVSSVLVKLEVSDRTQAALFAVKHRQSSDPQIDES